MNEPEGPGERRQMQLLVRLSNACLMPLWFTSKKRLHVAFCYQLYQPWTKVSAGSEILLGWPQGPCLYNKLQTLQYVALSSAL